MTSRRVPGRFPAPGTSEIGDRIRQRRGPRGITALDAALLHAPPVADGWNSLLGGIRNKGNLPGDLQELLVSIELAVLFFSGKSIRNATMSDPKGADANVAGRRPTRLF